MLNRYKVFFVSLSTIATVIHANNIESLFVQDISKSTLMTSQKSFVSGTHELKNEDDEMQSLYVAFKYNFESSTDYNFFVSLSGGISSYNTDNPSVGTIGDNSDIDSLVTEFGGGLRYKLDQYSHIALGASVIYSSFEANYIHNSAISEDSKKIIDNIYNKSDKAFTYKTELNYDYTREINNHKAYLQSSLAYFNTEVDDLSPTSSSVLSYIKVGVYSPELLKIANLPFKTEVYMQETILGGDISDNMDMTNFTTLGVAFHLYTDTIVPIVDNVYFDVNYVTGDNIDALHLGLSISF